MTTNDLIEAITEVATSAPGNARWRVHNRYECGLSAVAGGIRVKWDTDLGAESFDIVPGLVRESDIVITENDFRHSFRFRHSHEGEVVMTCQFAFREK